MARELVREVRKNITVDWTVRQRAHAKVRVLEQAEVSAGCWGRVVLFLDI